VGNIITGTISIPYHMSFTQTVGKKQTGRIRLLRAVNWRFASQHTSHTHPLHTLATLLASKEATSGAHNSALRVEAAYTTNNGSLSQQGTWLSGRSGRLPYFHNLVASDPVTSLMNTVQDSYE
jgi:hypothetical protein